MKIRVHDDIGYSPLSVRRAYWQCEDMEQLHTLAEQRRTTIRLLHADVPDAPIDALEYATLRAKELGAAVELTGDFPKSTAAPGAVFSRHPRMHVQLHPPRGRREDLCRLPPDANHGSPDDHQRWNDPGSTHLRGRRSDRPSPPGGTGAGDHGHTKPSALRADDRTSHTGGINMTYILIVEDQPMV